jgi:hypothetical protein
MGTSGLGAIGTPEACAAQIERLWQQSKGGFGASLAVVIPQHLASGRGFTRWICWHMMHVTVS